MQDRHVDEGSAAFQLALDVGDELGAESSPYLHVELQDGLVKKDYRARELGGAERETWWERAVEAWPYYAEYVTNTDRLMPVFVLVPADA